MVCNDRLYDTLIRGGVFRSRQVPCVGVRRQQTAPPTRIVSGPCRYNPRTQLPAECDLIFAKPKVYPSPSPASSKKSIAAAIAIRLLHQRDKLCHGRHAWLTSLVLPHTILKVPQTCEADKALEHCLVLGSACFAARVWPLQALDDGVTLLLDLTAQWQWLVVTSVEDYRVVPWQEGVNSVSPGIHGFLTFLRHGHDVPLLAYALARSKPTKALEQRVCRHFGASSCAQLLEELLQGHPERDELMKSPEQEPTPSAVETALTAAAWPEMDDDNKKDLEKAKPKCLSNRSLHKFKDTLDLVKKAAHIEEGAPGGGPEGGAGDGGPGGGPEGGAGQGEDTGRRDTYESLIQLRPSPSRTSPVSGPT